MMPNTFPIVGIGASAGGVEALEGFFRGVPDQPGLGFVIVTHLSPDRESTLHEIIGRYTDMTVEVAVDGLTVEPNCVYVLPADAILSIEKRKLLIRRPSSNRRERKPIDIFFSALAADQGELAAGVVLSGGDGDGTLGIKAIKERGGLTLAQVRDGYGPAHPDMPDSAISTGFVDFAVPADEMGAKLAEFARSLDMLDGLAETSRATDDGETLDRARQEIYAILRTQVGHEFGGYKSKTFLRRVRRRMQIRQIDTVEAYVELLREEPQEVGALFRDLLINVTNFFRDHEAFDNLAELVVPKLFEGRGADDTIRVWVPGCATGEEVFSIGILMREHIDRLAAVPRVQIFATDIDEHALSVARAGRYPATLLESVSQERRQRFFILDGGSYVVSKEVRDLCIFSPHSVIRDPPFSRIDLVSCRNLLIYFGLDVQGQVIPIFHYALRPEGYLFLGTSENITPFGDLFAPVEKKHRIFRRRSDVVPSGRLPLAISGLRPGHVSDRPMRQPAPGGIALRQSVESQVLDQFAPPYVVVNREGDVVFYSGRTGKYLEAAHGMPTRQILAIARKGLRLDLRTVLRESVDTGRAVTRDGIAVEGDDGRVQMVSLTVAPTNKPDGSEPLFLVLFADQGPTLSREEAASRASSPHDGASLHLDAELRETRERLQSLVEEYETALEELKSSNEELVSVNEELQSTNEELEASKEELQSVNEELHTLNADLNGKIESLDRANSDLQNLFESTEIATVFLDRSLAIRSFTPAVAKVFNILPSDRGRPITDLSSRFTMPDFRQDIADVFAGHGSAQRQVAHDDKAHYLVRIGPYRNAEQRIAGVVVTFVDVTPLTEAEARQRVLIAELQHRTRNLLTVVQSIARQTFAKGQALDSFATRLAALGRVQSLISKATGDVIDLADIIRLELQAHGSDQSDRILVEGPPVALGVDSVQTFALALHELATNAVKYGALKEKTGRLEIAWTVSRSREDGQALVLHWRESGVAMPPPETFDHGSGRKLIERALAYTLQAKTQLSFGEGGVSCRIEMPLARGAGDDRDKETKAT
ncbi:MAG TPA: CheR family methyltransferase [Lichenihabitans sp.]|jgi:two-component system CheB/CheR fusion protein|nr:CheR family methyltransferase [Lichenihabitans sp.]